MPDVLTALNTVVVVTATTYTAKHYALVLASAAANNVVVTIPIYAGTHVTIKRTDNTPAYSVSITPASGTIDGATTYVLSSRYATISTYSDGTNVWIV